MIDERRLVELALRLVSTPSFTGPSAAAELVRDVFAEDLRARSAVAAGRGRPGERRRHVGGDRGGPTLMFNGHLDTSYSGREPWLHGIPGSSPRASSDKCIYGLGISNRRAR